MYMLTFKHFYTLHLANLELGVCDVETVSQFAIEDLGNHRQISLLKSISSFVSTSHVILSDKHPIGFGCRFAKMPY